MDLRQVGEKTNLDLGFAQNGVLKFIIDWNLRDFIYDNPVDNNGDGFTDLTLAKAESPFSKIQSSPTK